MDDERWAPGMPELHRQDVTVRRDAQGRPLVPSRVPETRPTPLTGVFIWFSIVVFVCGSVVISALELGTPASSPVIKVPALVGAAVLLLVGVDSIVRVWRSAWAWMPISRGRGLFRFVWIVAIAAGLLAVAVAAFGVLVA